MTPTPKTREYLERVIQEHHVAMFDSEVAASKCKELIEAIERDDTYWTKILLRALELATKVRQMNEFACPVCGHKITYQQDVIEEGANIPVLCDNDACEAELLIQVAYILEAWNPRPREGGEL